MTRLERKNSTAVAQQLPSRPRLVTTALTDNFWDQANFGQLLLQRCNSCGNYQHYPRSMCSQCWSESLEWMPSGGNGSVWTFTVVHIPGHPAWSDETPYTIALVELDEGPRVMTRIINCPPEEVSVGMAVQIHPTWDEQLNQTLLNFEPAQLGSN